MGARTGKCKLGTKAGKSKLWARAGKHKLGHRADKYELGAGTVDQGQVRGQRKKPAAGKYKHPHWSRCFTYGGTRWLICTRRNWKPSQSEILIKHVCPFLNLFFFRCFSHIFAIANQLPGFSISRLANVEDFFNVNIFKM